MSARRLNAEQRIKSPDASNSSADRGPVRPALMLASLETVAERPDLPRATGTDAGTFGDSDIGSESRVASPLVAPLVAKTPTGEAPNNSKLAAAAGPARRNGAKRALLVTAGLAALLVAGWYGYRYWTVGRFIVSTDDAYVGAHMAMISPKVPANVIQVAVVDNQHVKAGDVLVRLDDGDYKLAVEQAATKLATQHAAIATYDAQIRSAEAGVEQASAQLDANRATLARTEADFQRTATLAARDYSSKATLDAARAARDGAKAQVIAQQAAIASADANVAVLKAQKDQAEKLSKELEVAVAKAKHDLSFTVIRAPFDGVVGNRSVQVGDYVTAGKRLAALVPLDKIYIDANLKETQLAHVAPGEHVKVHVDALDGEALDGTVESIAPASGSQFSLLPPENATGNFTKIVQRVPVRVAVDTAAAKDRLRPGLSVIVDIDTRTAPGRKPTKVAAVK